MFIISLAFYNTGRQIKNQWKFQKINFKLDSDLFKIPAGVLVI
jgi:hypothetical protein